MLHKKRRISRKDFPYILKTGRRFTSPHLLLYSATKESGGDSVFSFSVSKKVAKSAVERNTYRRRGYSVISKHITGLKPGYSNFFVFKNTNSLSYNILEKEILELLFVSRLLS